MAFNLTFPSFTPPPPDRALRSTPLPAVPQNPEAGSLVIIDYFQDFGNEPAHGHVGAYAAQQHGFRGPIYAEQIGPDSGQVSQAMLTSNWLSERPRTPEQTREALIEYSSQQQSGLLNDVTGDLDKLQERGLHDSAVNVSFGTQPQHIAKQLYDRVRTALDQQSLASLGFGTFGSNPASQGELQFAHNVLRAYGIDQTKIQSSDPNVSGPERQRLQQSLLDAAQAGRQSPEVEAARATYGQAVRNLEANNNSVVVSAGNQEQVLDRFAADAGGRRVQAAANSNHNVLVNSDVTAAGATRWFNSGQERLAGYSNRDPEVDIYASGSVGTGVNQNAANNWGTSYAAPRVAAMMASLHGTRPGTPSHAVQNLMVNRLTHEVQGEPVLSFGKAEEYMRRGTF